MSLNICCAQINFSLGDVEVMTDRVIELSQQAKNDGHDLIVFPELTLTGYPPEDLLLRRGLYLRIETALHKLCDQISGIDVIVGFPWRENDKIYNAAALIRDGKIDKKYYKQCLPNYGVFDEKRYFEPGTESCIFDLKGRKVALVICEDLWFPGPLQQAKALGAEFAIGINASPFDVNKPHARQKIIRDRANETNLPILYVHWTAGQDELVFDGGSLMADAQGNVVCQAPYFEECLYPIHMQWQPEIAISRCNKETVLDPIISTYRALTLGVRDYIVKNHFKGAIVGLSGGIDSAVTLAIAADAIGPENLHAVMMPSQHTSQLSLNLAKQQADTMGIHYSVIDIEPIFASFNQQLSAEFAQFQPDITEENLQARIRGTLLMALSNKTGKIVLTTSNKSEMAVGYSTLYGDMAGGFCVLKDVFKQRVYELAHYRNALSSIIPDQVITRAPSAELAPDQKDQDTLPEYAQLDEILKLYVELDYSVKQIIAEGFAAEVVKKIVKMIDRSEYKRRQSPPGIRITTRAFGRDRRYPITSSFNRAHIV